jgi:hypothetical protein
MQQQEDDELPATEEVDQCRIIIRWAEEGELEDIKILFPHLYLRHYFALRDIALGALLAGGGGRAYHPQEEAEGRRSPFVKGGYGYSARTQRWRPQIHEEEYAQSNSPPFS